MKMIKQNKKHKEFQMICNKLIEATREEFEKGLLEVSRHFFNDMIDGKKIDMEEFKKVSLRIINKNKK